MAAALDAVAPIPGDPDGPVFGEPWQAQAFAMAVALHAGGLFTWPEWAAALAQEIATAQERSNAGPGAADPGAADPGDAYYRHWLAALERLVAAKGVASGDDLAVRKAAWDRAARATPHGRPILIDNDPLR
jgi:nitrile hydratase accessory protein